MNVCILKLQIVSCQQELQIAVMTCLTLLLVVCTAEKLLAEFNAELRNDHLKNVIVMLATWLLSESSEESEFNIS